MLEDFGNIFLENLKRSSMDAFNKFKAREEFKKDYPYVMKTIDCLFRLNTNEDEIVKCLLDYYGFLGDQSQHLIAEYKINKKKGFDFKYKGDFD